jgi:4-carboxymuconolactone decarboxylase
MPRVKLIQDKIDLPEEHHALFDELAAFRGRISGPSSVVLHSPDLARSWNRISEYLHGLSVVEHEHSELAVCATAREFDCDYIWAAHVPQARSAGVSERALKAVAEDSSLEELPLAEAQIVTYVRQLIRGRRVGDDLFARLLEDHSPRWLLELTAWIGRYGALAGILNAFAVSPTPEAERLPTRAPGSEALRLKPLRAPAATARVTPITTRDQMEKNDRPIFDAVAAGRGNVRGPFALLLYSPQLCRDMLDLSNYLRLDEFLSPRVRELAVIATARERDCPYVWAAHAPACRRAGIADSVILAVRDRKELVDITPMDADVTDFVRQLLRRHEVEENLFGQMVARHSIPGLVELTAIIGHYVFVTSILNAFEMAPAPDAEKLPLT